MTKKSPIGSDGPGLPASGGPKPPRMAPPKAHVAPGNPKLPGNRQTGMTFKAPPAKGKGR